MQKPFGHVWLCSILGKQEFDKQVAILRLQAETISADSTLARARTRYFESNHSVCDPLGLDRLRVSSTRYKKLVKPSRASLAAG